MGNCMTGFVDKLAATGNLSGQEFSELLKFRNIETTEYLFEQARITRQNARGKDVQIWGRIPVSNFCKNNCKMCGIRRDNQFVKRYRMELEQVLKNCGYFYEKGIHTFLLESGDDVYYSEARLNEMVLRIRKQFPKCRIVLAMGDKNRQVYSRLKNAGVAGYILNHGTANALHFKKVFPSNMSPLLKKQGLWELKELGYQVGSGFLVGLPYQTIEHVVEDIWFLKNFGAEIIQIGAFIPALRTPFEQQRSGNGEMTLYIMAILRLMLPKATIIASPTLDVVLKDGRMRCFDAGADTLLMDLPDEQILNQYGVYERKSGRMYLPGDKPEILLEQLRTMDF